MNTVRKMIDNTSKLNIKKLTLIVIVIWVILAIIFGFYDLAISIAFVDENSLWGIFGKDYGEPPGYGLIAVALATLIGGYIKDLKKQKIPSYLSIVAGIIYLILGEDETDMTTGLFLIIPAIILIIITWNKDLSQYRSISAVITLLAIFYPLLFVQLTKLLAGRVRFRDLALDYSNFTPWFLPPGPSGNYSFPSGHTAMGWMFLPLLITVKDRKIKDPLRIIITVLVIGWGLFVGLSRIAVGAHYASDVLFSTGAATIITIFLYTRFYRKRNKSD